MTDPLHPNSPRGREYKGNHHSLSQLLVDWAMIEHWRVMSDGCSPDLQMMVARMLALKHMQKECGHDNMKFVTRIGSSSVWHCQGCGQLQQVERVEDLKMPGTFFDDPPSEALGVELSAWQPPWHDDA